MFGVPGKVRAGGNGCKEPPSVWPEVSEAAASATGATSTPGRSQRRSRRGARAAEAAPRAQRGPGAAERAVPELADRGLRGCRDHGVSRAGFGSEAVEFPDGNAGNRGSVDPAVTSHLRERDGADGAEIVADRGPNTPRSWARKAWGRARVTRQLPAIETGKSFIVSARSWACSSRAMIASNAATVLGSRRGPHRWVRCSGAAIAAQ